jgi:hypothetical protein
MMSPSDRAAAVTTAAAPTLHVADGTLEVLKWLALAAMTLDHINTYLWNHSSPASYAVGRLALPLFAFTLAYRLAQPQAVAHGMPRRVMLRLLAAGLCAVVPRFLLASSDGGCWPLNVMFTLATGTAIAWLCMRGGRWVPTLVMATFFFVGPFLEFWWFGLACFFGAWWFCRRPGVASFLGCAGGCASLYAVNGNYWALAALPLIAASPCLAIAMPRARHLFYYYYPLHLAVLLIVRVASDSSR